LTAHPLSNLCNTLLIDWESNGFGILNPGSSSSRHNILRLNIFDIQGQILYTSFIKKRVLINQSCLYASHIRMRGHMPEDFKPWTWKPPEGFSALDYNASRQDAYDKVSGQAVYTRDLYFPGMLYAKILTSPYVSAKIVSMDTSKAEALTGVRDILKFDDPDIQFENTTGGYCSSEYNILTLPSTSDFYQHPIGVVVVADSEEICENGKNSLSFWRWKNH